MNRSALIELLTRYETHRCTREESQLVEQWYELLGESVEIPFSEEQWMIIEQKLWRQLQPSAPETEPGSGPAIMPMWRKAALIISGVAALIAIAIGLNWNRLIRPALLGEQLLVTQVEKTTWTQYYNESANIRKINLADGSVVMLAAHAQLAVHKDFNKKNRDVRLLGDAGFNVHRDTSKPFLVYSGDIITKVLGTTFQVRAQDPGQPIQVTVQSGKVTVYRQAAAELTDVRPSSGVILTPNQKATYFPDNKQFVTGITEDPQPIKASVDELARASLVFEETPISEVIHRLEVLYGTEIELEQESLSQCPFTGNLTHQALYTKLELLCGTINGSYEVRGTKILVTGKGCQ